MTPLNDYYGHRAVLNGYIGARLDHPFGGVLQHGWHLTGHVQASGRARALPRYFTWGRRDVSGRAVPIGAPFLYHPRVIDPRPHQPTGTVLAMPYHGYGSDLDGAHQRYAATLEARRTDHDDVIVSLHPSEYDSPVRAIYEAHGYQVVTNGPRKSVDFLDRLITRLEEVDAVTTNRLSTGLLYAAALGRRVDVSGPFPAAADHEFDGVSRAEQERRYLEAFPQLADGLEGDDARRLADDELGRENLRSPEDLARVLWVGGVRGGLSRSGQRANRAITRVAGSRRPPPER